MGNEAASKQLEDPVNTHTPNNGLANMSQGDYSALLARLKEDLNEDKIGRNRVKAKKKSGRVQDQYKKTIPPPGIPVNRAKKRKSRDLTKSPPNNANWIEY